MSQREDRIASAYFQEVGREAQPTAAQEKQNFTDLLVARQNAEKAEKTLRRRRLPEDERRRAESNLRVWRAKITRLEQEIPKGYLRFVIKVARKYTRDEQLLKELVGAGNCGLMDAVYRFDVTVGTRFLTYADYWINVRIQEYLNRDQLVHVPNHVRKANRRQRRLEEAEMALGQRRDYSFEEPAFAAVDPETLASEPVPAAVVSLVGHMVDAGLSRRERLVLSYLYGFLGDGEHDLAEIALRFYAIDGSVFAPAEIAELRDAGLEKLKEHLQGLGVAASFDLL